MGVLVVCAVCATSASAQSTTIVVGVTPGADTLADAVSQATQTFDSEPLYEDATIELPPGTYSVNPLDIDVPGGSDVQQKLTIEGEGNKASDITSASSPPRACRPWSPGRVSSAPATPTPRRCATAPAVRRSPATPSR